MMKKELKNKKIAGITLIALVVTIIVLLILAGISISMLSGNNSILEQAERAKDLTGKVQMSEVLQLAVLGGYDNNGNLNVNKVKENIEKEANGTTVSGNNFPLTVTAGEETYIIESDGTLKDLNEIINVFNLRYEYGYLWLDCYDWKKNIDSKSEKVLNSILENYLKIIEKELRMMGATDEQIESEVGMYRTELQNKTINEKREIVNDFATNMELDVMEKCLYNNSESIKLDKGLEFSWKVENPGNYTVSYLNLEKSADYSEKSINIDTLDPYIIDRTVYHVYSGEMVIKVLHLNNGNYEEIIPDKVIMRINGEEIVNGERVDHTEDGGKYETSKDFEEKYKTYEGQIIAFIGEKRVEYKGPIYISGGE